jgi:catechol 2,3-dioxygenase
METTQTTPYQKRESALLSDQLALGPVHLAVSNLDHSIDFYERSIGLRLLKREGATAWLGSNDTAVLQLIEEPDSVRAGKHAGLYHVALLFPSRDELAKLGHRLIATKTPITGASDHGTHEAFYLSDPDGNGLELAADRPRDQWAPYTGQNIALQPLDIEDLLASVPSDPVQERTGPGVRVGHLHLHVGDLDAARTFYVDVIGFDEQFAFDTAAFVSAGGYHHHLGMNTWQGVGAKPAPEGVFGLRSWSFTLPTAADVQELRARAEAAGVTVEESDAEGAIQLRDPWGHLLIVAPESAA